MIYILLGVIVGIILNNTNKNNDKKILDRFYKLNNLKDDFDIDYDSNNRIIELTIQYPNITNFNLLTNLSNLRTLSLTDNQINEIPKEINKLKKLEKF